MPEEVEECVRSVLEENPDYDEERAYKICNAAKNKGELESFDPADPISVFLAAPGEADLRVMAGPLEGGPQVERIEEGDGKVRYTNIMLLDSGEWTDALKRETIFYAPEAIERSASNWIDVRDRDDVNKAPLNHYHEHDKPAENLGHVDVTSVKGLNGSMYGDLVFHCRTQRSEEMERMMQLALETDGEEGLGGVSVEIAEEETKWDPERGLYRMKELWFSGVGVVQEPAASTVSFDEQFENRAVALASGETDRNVTVMTRTGETSMPPDDEQGHMDGDTISERLRALREDVAEAERMLQNETDLALDALSTFLEQEGSDESADLAAFQAWAQDALDEATAAAIQTAINGFLDAAGMEPGEATVGEFRDWAEGSTTSEEEAEGGEEGEMQEPAGDTPEEPEGDGEGGKAEAKEPETPEEVVDTLDDVANVVKKTAEKAAEAVGEAEETQEEVTAMRQEMEELERRLAEVEDAPVIRSLAEGKEAEDDDEHPEDTSFRYARKRGTIERL